MYLHHDDALRLANNRLDDFRAAAGAARRARSARRRRPFSTDTIHKSTET